MQRHNGNIDVSQEKKMMIKFKNTEDTLGIQHNLYFLLCKYQLDYVYFQLISSCWVV